MALVNNSPSNSKKIPHKTRLRTVMREMSKRPKYWWDIGVYASTGLRASLIPSAVQTIAGEHTGWQNTPKKISSARCISSNPAMSYLLASLGQTV